MESKAERGEMAEWVVVKEVRMEVEFQEVRVEVKVMMAAFLDAQSVHEEVYVVKETKVVEPMVVLLVAKVVAVVREEVGVVTVMVEEKEVELGVGSKVDSKEVSVEKMVVAMEEVSLAVVLRVVD